MVNVVQLVIELCPVFGSNSLPNYFVASSLLLLSIYMLNLVWNVSLKTVLTAYTSARRLSLSSCIS